MAEEYDDIETGENAEGQVEPPEIDSRSRQENGCIGRNQALSDECVEIIRILEEHVARSR